MSGHFDLLFKTEQSFNNTAFINKKKYMTKVKVSIDYSTHNYSDKELAIQGLTVGENLSDNRISQHWMKQQGIKSASEILNGYLTNMASGNKQLTAEKNLARTNLENMLGSAAMKVQDSSEGTEF